MIGAIGLAMGALSSVSSLIDQAASSASNAVNPPPVQSFTASPAPPKKASLPSVPMNAAGPPIPKFDKRAHAALLSAQERYLHL
jgi:hypothetical protein